MAVTSGGRVMDSRPLFSNTLIPSSTKPLGSVTATSLSQFLKAPSSIFVTVTGMLTVVMLLQLRNVFLAIIAKSVGSVTDCRPEHPSNDDSPTLFTL